MVKYPTAGTESYTYDNAGNRLSKTNHKATGGVPTVNLSTAYSYDSLNRMTESLTDDILLAYKGRTTYEYDNNGNLIQETIKRLDYVTEQELTSDPVTGLPLQPQMKSYEYDVFNRNISVTNPDGSFQYNVYDALGYRISVIENGYRSDFVFDRGNIITEFDGSGTLKNRNIRGYTLLAQKDDKGRPSYYLHDAHGDITSMIDASGKVLNSYTYDAFGNTTTYAEKVANRFRYAGEQFDSITGQYYLRARYYDPTVGRFTQEDTYRGDGMNLYAYVGNNPVNFIDPSGHAQVRGDGVSGGGKCSQGTGNAAITSIGAGGRSGGGGSSGYYGYNDGVGETTSGSNYSSTQVDNNGNGIPDQYEYLIINALGSIDTKGATNAVKYGPMNKGPLADEIANTFRSGTYTKIVTQEETTLYRVYGGKAGELGSYWTRTKPQGPLQSTIDSALDQNWGNTATNVSSIKVPKGTTIYDGYAAEQRGLLGGGNQVYIEKVDASWLVK